MPVRIYDISKKLGLENKEVISKAKALGIAVRVASSSLDKITAEYLEQQLILDHPQAAPQPTVTPPPVATPPQESITLVAPPVPAEAIAKQEPVAETAPALLEPEPPPVAPPVIEEPVQASPTPAEIQPPPEPVE